MSPAFTPVISALERAATLIEKGVQPAKALRQVAQELTDYAESKASYAPTHMIPSRSFAGQLGETRKVA